MIVADLSRKPCKSRSWIYSFQVEPFDSAAACPTYSRQRWLKRLPVPSGRLHHASARAASSSRSERGNGSPSLGTCEVFLTITLTPRNLEAGKTCCCRGQPRREPSGARDPAAFRKICGYDPYALEPRLGGS